MKCPDCKNSDLIFEELYLGSDPDYYGTSLENPIYKCPKCRTEYEPEELEDVEE